MLTSYIIRACPCKHSDVISLKYTDIRGGSLDWISGFQSGFLDFKVDFWISDWISGFQSGFLDFRLDFCRQCTRFLSWRTHTDASLGPLSLNCALGVKVGLRAAVFYGFPYKLRKKKRVHSLL